MLKMLKIENHFLSETHVKLSFFGFIYGFIMRLYFFLYFRLIDVCIYIVQVRSCALFLNFMLNEWPIFLNIFCFLPLLNLIYIIIVFVFKNKIGIKYFLFFY